MRIAVFDFDGTVTTKDTLLEFIKFVRGPVSFYAGFLRYAPQLLAYKSGIYPNWFMFSSNLHSSQASFTRFYHIINTAPPPVSLSVPAGSGMHRLPSAV